MACILTLNGMHWQCQLSYQRIEKERLYAQYPDPRFAMMQSRINIFGSVNKQYQDSVAPHC